MAANPSEDLHSNLTQLFQANPESYHNAQGEIAVPARAIPSLLRAYEQAFLAGDGDDVGSLLSPAAEQQLSALAAGASDLEITPPHMLQLIIQLSESLTPHGGASARTSPTPVNETPIPPPEPAIPGPTRPNALEARQRSQPLEKATLSSFRARPQRNRGRSDSNMAVLMGEEEDNIRKSPETPISPRQRAKKRLSVQSYFSGRGSSTNFGYSSPDSSMYDDSYSSNDRIRSPDFSPAEDSPSSFSFSQHSSSDYLPVRHQLRKNRYPDRRINHDDDDELDDFDRGMIHGASEDDTLQLPTASAIRRKHTISSSFGGSDPSPEERLDSLQRSNAELAKQLRDSNREMEGKMSDHEREIDELQTRIDELKIELQISRREEKELKNKARTTSSQLMMLESEIVKLQKALDASRAQYQNMTRQYNEQCAISENYRNMIRTKDEELKVAEEVSATHEHELSKWKVEREHTEAAIETLTTELTIAQEAQDQLEEQKAANLALKETIDRLHLDLDELRRSSASTARSGGSSAKNSLSRAALTRETLAGLAKELGDEYGSRVGLEDEDEEGDDGERVYESEDGFVETIITTSRKRVGVRRRGRVVGEFKEYTDAFTQHELSEFTSTSIIQTDALPSRSLATTSTQTDPEPTPLRRKYSEFASQTDLLSSSIPEEDDDDDDDGDDTRSSTSTSTAVAMTPSPYSKAKGPIIFPPIDLPPSYAHLQAEDRKKIGAQYIQRWHPGTLSTVADPAVPTGPTVVVSREAVEEWKNLKRELGFNCLAIDKVLDPKSIEGSDDGRAVSPSPLSRSGVSSALTMTPRLAREWASKVKAQAEEEEAEEERRSGRSSMKGSKKGSPRRRFYDAYSDAFYPPPETAEATSKKNWNAVLTTAGVWALVFMTAAVIPNLPSSSKAPMYSDRQLWQSYNSLGQVPPLEGFAGPNPGRAAGEAVWDLTGRVIYGAAKALQRAPPS